MDAQRLKVMVTYGNRNYREVYARADSQADAERLLSAARRLGYLDAEIVADEQKQAVKRST